jgi:DNA-directed RNA polymerase specialized sigma24 family protein
MSSVGSVTYWVGRLQAGDPAAAQPLWEGYYRRLVGLARANLRGAPRRAADEEDVALSAFDSFCRGAAAGRFPRLDDRGDLWQVLLLVTARKAIDLVQHEARAKRGGGRVRPVTDLVGGGGAGSPEAPDRGPDPAEAALVAEACRRLLEKLRDAEQRSVALWKMEGYTNAEIAAKLGCVVGTVERKLRVIRSIWGAEGSP